MLRELRRNGTAGVSPAGLAALHDEHQISGITRRQLQYDLDLEEGGLLGGR